jgi:hypothetical protein
VFADGKGGRHTVTDLAPHRKIFSLIILKESEQVETWPKAEYFQRGSKTKRLSNNHHHCRSLMESTEILKPTPVRPSPRHITLGPLAVLDIVVVVVIKGTGICAYPGGLYCKSTYSLGYSGQSGQGGMPEVISNSRFTRSHRPSREFCREFSMTNTDADQSGNLPH